MLQFGWLSARIAPLRRCPTPSAKARTTGLALAALVAVGVAVAPLSAGQIDLRLDVTYAGGLPSAGGAWKLFAKTDEQGLFSLRVRLGGVDPITGGANQLPRGTVNGSDQAGFSLFFTNPLQGGVQELFTAQQLLGPSSSQQGVFYGVGTLANGSPDYPGAPGGTSQLGPNITSLTAVQNVPWATEDPLWPTGVTVASGTFSAGDNPGFAAAATSPMGSLLTTIGTNTTPGERTDAVAFTTEVLTNLAFGVATGDYNDNGVVDAADYTLWRDTLGQTVPALTGADGDGDGSIDDDDYQVWATNFGRSALATATAVPEPAGGVMAGLWAALAWLLGRRTMVSPVFAEKSGHLPSLA